MLTTFPALDKRTWRIENSVGVRETGSPPEKNQEFGFMYAGLKGPVTWTIPKIDIIGNLIDSKPWGTNYHWNYHNGGLAWAMKVLSEMTGKTKYGKYADEFCDFQLRSVPFISYEKNVLGY